MTSDTRRAEAVSAETSRDRIATAIDIASANCLIGVAGVIRDLAAERDAATARAEAAELRAAECVVATNKRDRERMQAEREARNAEAQRDAATAERDRMRAALEPFASPMMDSVQTDVRTAHLSRGNGASEAMHDDDRDLRADLRKAVDAARAALAGAAKEA